MEPAGHGLPRGSAGALPRAQRRLQVPVCWHGAGGLSPPAGGRSRHGRGPPGSLDVVTEDGSSRSASRLRTFCFPIPKLVTLPAWAMRGVTVAPAYKSQDAGTLCCPFCPQPPCPTEVFPLGGCGRSCSPSGCFPSLAADAAPAADQSEHDHRQSSPGGAPGVHEPTAPGGAMQRVHRSQLPTQKWVRRLPAG